MAFADQALVGSPWIDKPLSLCGVTTALVVCVSLYLVGSVFYSVKLHPLSRFPGPVSSSASLIPFWIAAITGQQVRWMQSLHRRYGPVVRYGPNQLSYVDQDSASWKAIHGAEKGGREFPKAKEWFVRPSNGKLKPIKTNNMLLSSD